VEGLTLPTFNWEINVSDVVLVAGGIWAFVWMLLGQRDINRDVLRILKGSNGTNGMITDVHLLKNEMYYSGGRVSRLGHHIATIRQALSAKGIETLAKDEPSWQKESP
jgi:hypothetical protein